MNTLSSKPSNMLVALDYDGTYTRDPSFWDFFIEHLVIHPSHDIVVVTYRDERYDKTPFLLDLEEYVDVYYTRGTAKAWWMEQFAPEEHRKPDIWIDDRPKAIYENSGLDRDGLREWRDSQTINKTERIEYADGGTQNR